MFRVTSARRHLLLGQDFRMHPHHQAFLVIGAVEDADAAALRQRDHAAPQEIVIEFERRRLLERMHLAALRVDAVEDALDRAVLAGRIHALKDQQQRPAVLGVELFLKIVQPLAVGLDDLLALVLVEAALLAGLVRFEMELARSVDSGTARQRACSSSASGCFDFLLMIVCGMPSSCVFQSRRARYQECPWEGI